LTGINLYTTARFALWLGVSMNIGSLAIAVAELKMVQSVIAAIDAVAPGLGGPGKVERGVDRFEPRRVLHPTPRFLPRTVLHPTPRFLPRPVLHPAPRVEDKGSPIVETPPVAHSSWPFPPTWKVLPPVHSHSSQQNLKIAAPRIDIRSKGTLVDLFI
jgi:hypothetical protein